MQIRPVGMGMLQTRVPVGMGMPRLRVLAGMGMAMPVPENQAEAPVE